MTANGSSFAGFSGGLTGTTNPQNVTMSGPVTVTAAFSTNVYTPTPAFSGIVVPVGGSSTVMFLVSSSSSSQSSGGGQAIVRPRVKRPGQPRDGGCSFSSEILNGSCYSDGNSGMSMAITQAIDYVSSEECSTGSYFGAFWATFSAESSAPVPGPFQLTCDCVNSGCTLGFEPVNTVPATPQLTGTYPPQPWHDHSGSPAWADGNPSTIPLGGTSCDAGSVTVPADAAGTAGVSVASNVSAPSVTITVMRDAITHFSAIASPAGGTFEYSVLPSPTDCGIGTCPTPTLTLDQGVTPQSNPGSGSLANPGNPCSGAPCPPNARFSFPVLGTSCYYTPTQSQFRTAPSACLTMSGAPSPLGDTLNPPGLTSGDYCNSFLKQLQTQGSAILNNGTIVQYWSKAYHTLRPGQQLTGSGGTPVVANQTLAFDPAFVPNLTNVTLYGVDSTASSAAWRANDSGGFIAGYRVDPYRGVGAHACTGANANNVLAISSSSPTNTMSFCPGSTGVFQCPQ